MLDAGLRQPDAFTCGAQSVVVAGALCGRTVPTDAPGFARLVLDTHRRLTSPRSASGRSQLPWPRRLGTPPWAVAAEMRQLTGLRYHALAVAPQTRDRRWSAALTAVRAGHPVPLYVGNRWLPRHVVLAVAARRTDQGDHLVVHDPATGHLRILTGSSWRSASLRLSGWDVGWLVLAPT